MKEMLEEEEATESDIMLSVASSPDDITTIVLRTLCCFQSTHFLSPMGWNLHLLKGRGAGGGRER